MKLVLANNQTDRFVSFYQDLRAKSGERFDYAPYETLLFSFDSTVAQPIRVQSLTTGKQLQDYDGVYLNGYLDTYELAATMATCADALHVPFVNREMANAPSLSKLTAYATLAAQGVTIPRTIAGCQAALAQASEQITAALTFPIVLKRADADRGIDNFKVESIQEVQEILADQPPRSMWIAQAFIPNDGFYLVTYYDGQPKFSIFRTLETRPDGNARKAHMFKPKGGANASLLQIEDVPSAVTAMCQQAIDAMNRQIGSVDCIYTPETGDVYVLEVNYNPQFVTVSTFQDVRLKAFLEGIEQID